ncbi:hypothetical protein PUNSTDRAFT_63207 [Punctularia strigosozonata HHB-11173 SS5]|uniref:uncharacterized protein n=1 Tax=Punctularia strigosozonata (strain HHB-11173) TaxID=741275 RepID=UPI0004416E6C|nr:uncharacterized protein PUNSTDRAFT_63207 [Punctularia strigosozonata HHB-11173 SS5]EIN11377.1 hypothetical protein PUNSTDRAFT_63207 [Punctularia strigosozonata HHB-11173 SS5]
MVLGALPQVDFDRMGKVGLAGSFAGLDVFSNSTVAFDPSTASLLSRSTNGALARLGSTNAGGAISAGCALGSTFYVAGTFSSINGTSASNIASYDASASKFSALGSNGPNGPIHALFCDSSNNKVWAGGAFSSPGKNVAVWDAKAQSWSAAPFGGLTGAASEVLSITTNSSSSSLFFAGSFITAFAGNGTSTLNSTNNPNVPFSKGASPFSSSLVPIPLQNAQIEGSPSTQQAEFSNIDNILCPAGADGPNNTWFAADGNAAVITARAFSFISAAGVRLGNTFLDSRGATGFKVTTIPDNTVQTLKFLDPTTGQNTTCSDPCPLSTDSSLLYQDFLFASAPLNITGVQVTLSNWTGAGPGLHIFQLLSSGAFASALADENSVSCFAPNPSNTTQTGDWTEKQANTGIPGTVQSVLVSDVNVGTSASTGPSFTWMPYVSASGDYNINFLVPGCTEFQDCNARTSVKVTVFPGGDQQPWVTTVDQTNTDDASTLIYSGPIVPSSTDFVVTVTMTLADQPVGNGQNGQWEIVADRIQMELTNANLTSTGTSGSGSGSNATTASTSGFGFFEWPLSSSDSSVNATSTLPNTTETALDAIGLELLTAMGGSGSLSSASAAVIAAVAHHPSGAVFLGGDFSLSSGSASGAKNIVMFKNGALASLAENGLNGAVTSLVVDGDTLFVGGAFEDTASGSTGGKVRGVGAYSVSGDKWAALQAGLNGAATSLGFANGQLQVAGNFTQIVSASSTSSGISSGGLAVWDAQNSTWVNSGGFLAGSMTFVGNGTAASKSQSQTQFVAGNVAASSQFGASGFVMLSNGGKDGVPTVTPLGVQLASGGNESASGTATRRRRSHVRAAAGLFPRLQFPKLLSRQSSTTSALEPLPTVTASSGPSVSAGAFWTNSTSKDEVVIIGGNFSFTSASGAEASNVAIYDPKSGSVTALQGSQPSGVVQALLVQGDNLFIGGQFTVEGTSANGFAVYDLANQKWASNTPPALVASSGSVLVRSLTSSESKDNTVIVAGSFTSAGSTSCQGICAWDTSNSQWTELGSGVQGDVVSVAYGGQSTLVASGSIALSGNTANVAAYTFANNSWSAIGSGSELPGPVTALEVNGGNLSSIFAAGRSSDSSSAFLSVWDGRTWSSLGSTLQSTTNISQLVMVPLSDTHTANSIIEKDRMLLVSGTLSESSFGNASSALFDGQTFHPYITSTSASGDPGAISALIHSFATFSFTKHHFLATGIVILISIAIAAGIVFLLVLIGILWTLFGRKEDADKFDPAGTDEDDDSIHHRPSSLLEHINAATRNTIMGSPAFGASMTGEKEAEAAAVAGVAAASQRGDVFGGDEHRPDTPSDAPVGVAADGSGRLAHARYSFDGREEGELPLSSGTEVEILDDRDAAWWYARDPNTGNEGVVPANYVY